MSGMCKDCFTGTIHDGTPTGKVENVHGLPTYVAESPSNPPPKGIVVIIPDAWGWDFNNNRIMADNYANKANCKVLLPDFMNGASCDYVVNDSMEALMGDASIFSKIGPFFHAVYHFGFFVFYNRESVSKPRVYNFFRRLRAANPSTPIGAAGFCWGGKWTTYLCAGWNNPAIDPSPSSNTFTPATAASKSKTDEILVDCGYAAHPSMLKIPRDVLALKRPLSIANGTKDIQLTPPLLEDVKRIFEQKGHGKPECELVIYDEAKHGFAVRWNPKNEREQKQGEEAEEQAVRWFGKHFAAKL